MAKSTYKIPDSLDKSWFDIQIAFKSSNGVGLRPLPLKFILSVILSALMCLGIVLNTPIKDSGPIFIAMFVIVWLLGSAFLLKLDKTGDMAISKLPVAVDYIPRANRHVLTRTSNDAGPFQSCSNLADCDEERGMVKFNDGDVGFVYRVVGTGSALLFEDDKRAILDRVDLCMRKLRTDYEMVFVTMRAPQNVKRQIVNQQARRSHLVDKAGRPLPGNEELVALVDTDIAYLSDYVGGSFKSIHQYLVLKAENEEALYVARNILKSEIEGSLLMFKRCTALFDDELERVFASVFKGEETL